MTLQLCHELRYSQLLSKAENESILQLLGSESQCFSMAVIQFFETDGPEGTEWQCKDFGVLCFVKDIIRHSHYFQLFCPIERKMLWEHEMYNGLQYQSLTKFFYCFEAEDRIVGFNFACEFEARKFEKNLTIIQKKIRKKRIDKSTKNNGDCSNIKKYTKEQIGKPENFIHTLHVGFDSNTQLYREGIKDSQLNEFFAKAGVSESQLRNPQIRNFIYEFIGKYSEEVIKADVQEPQVSPPLSPKDVAIPPPPPMMDCSILPQIGSKNEKPNEPVSDTLEHVDTSNSENKSNTQAPNSWQNLMDKIKEGKVLKPVMPVEKKDFKKEKFDGLAGALARALAEQFKGTHGDSESSEDEISDDNWDD